MTQYIIYVYIVTHFYAPCVCIPFLPVLWWCFQGPGASSTDDCAPWQAASAVQRNFTVERRKGSYSAGEMGITSASSALSVLIKSRRIWKVLLATSPPVAEPHFFGGAVCHPWSFSNKNPYTFWHQLVGNWIGIHLAWKGH